MNRRAILQTGMILGIALRFAVFFPVMVDTGANDCRLMPRLSPSSPVASPSGDEGTPNLPGGTESTSFIGLPR